VLASSALKKRHPATLDNVVGPLTGVAGFVATTCQHVNLKERTEPGPSNVDFGAPEASLDFTLKPGKQQMLSHWAFHMKPLLVRWFMSAAIVALLAATVRTTAAQSIGGGHGGMRMAPNFSSGRTFGHFDHRHDFAFRHRGDDRFFVRHHGGDRFFLRHQNRFFFNSLFGLFTRILLRSVLLFLFGLRTGLRLSVLGQFRRACATGILQSRRRQ
jgi:hypothetical protein